MNPFGSCIDFLNTAAKERMGVNETAEEHEWAEKVKKHRQRMRHAWVDEEHPGCQLSGHLLVDRVPVRRRPCLFACLFA